MGSAKLLQPGTTHCLPLQHRHYDTTTTTAQIMQAILALTTAASLGSHPQVNEKLAPLLFPKKISPLETAKLEYDDSKAANQQMFSTTPQNFNMMCTR
jgi:hypothetical protein